MGKSTEHWSYSTGERGRNRVRAFEEAKTGILYVEFYVRVAGSSTRHRKRVSLGHRDRTRAKQQADEIAARHGRAEPTQAQTLTLRELFDIYLGEVTPQKAESTRGHHRRCAEMFKRLFRSERPVHTLSKREWDAFVRQRGSGEIDARGHPVPPGHRQPVGNRTVARDLAWLRAVLRWATLAGDGQGGYLLDQNPLRGLVPPKEPNPTRPILTQERYEVMLAVAPEVGWRFELAFVLAHETGHRIGAIRRLRWSDIDVGAGRIRWRAEEDKVAHEHVTPLTSTAQEALRRVQHDQQAIGDAWVFPAVENAAQPCSKEYMYRCFLKAETKAGLEHVKALGWHGLRRKFATETKHHPVKDVAAAGGWKTEQTLLTCYQQADQSTMRQVVERRQALQAKDAFGPNRQYEPTVRDVERSVVSG